ncbi:DEAD/DEAH box helicase [Lachnospiraceae bacterium LCP25S3_G4]
MNNIIENIIRNKNIEEILNETISELFREGPNSLTTMEILSYMKMYQDEIFHKQEEKVLELMGTFYKNTESHTLEGNVFEIYKNYIKEKYNEYYTPVQANIVKNIKSNHCFSFSAPTSTGKSFVFRNLIKDSNNDVVVIVPSRALINEYNIQISKIVDVRTVNVLTFVDKINCKRASRNIFILTPERAKELFKYKEYFKVDLFLFDEAQLSNEETQRGMYFDSIVRRVQKAFPESRIVFAHPFVKNPDAQIMKNNFNQETSLAIQYQQKNVGQMFYCVDKNNKYYHFGINKDIMGSQKILAKHDPVERIIKENGSVLIYTAKASIYNKKAFERFDKYIRLCNYIEGSKIDKYIDELKTYLGAEDDRKKFHYSFMLDMLKRGIVIHHGSLPLHARMVIEKFTIDGFCKICFATSTLEQGINMPFDLVYLNKFEASKSLSLKNLIGRSGRSSSEKKFDYGIVVIKDSNKSLFRNIMTKDNEMSTESLLDIDEDSVSNDYKEFKQAIREGTFNDEYNLPETKVKELEKSEVMDFVSKAITCMFEQEDLISLDKINSDTECNLELYDILVKIYEEYLGRNLVDGERAVLNTAIKILLWKIYGRTFKQICWYRYSYATRLNEYRKLREQLKKSDTNKSKEIVNEITNMYASFVSQYAELPNPSLHVFSMFGYNETKIFQIEYDLIVYDTYDYLDKLIGFKLIDIYFTAFSRYYVKYHDERALILSKYFKYGTAKDLDIWLLRYGFDFEEIEWLEPCVDSVTEEEIRFNKKIKVLNEEQIARVSRFF